MDDAKRTKISGLEGKTVKSIHFPKAGHHVIFTFDDNSSLVVHPDHAFDEDGNRFNLDDLPSR